MTNLVLCLTEDVEKPYVFSKTSVAVYSLEEALFYIYVNWQYTDFTTDKFIHWVEQTLQLETISKKLKKIRANTNFTERLLDFLSITPFFDALHLSTLKATVEMWVSENQYVLLKEQADASLRDYPNESIDIYQKSLENQADATLYNNMGIAYANQFKYAQAVTAFEQAHQLEPHNIDILLNMAYVLIEYGDIPRAEALITSLDNHQNNSYANFLYSKIYALAKNLPLAISSLEKALAIRPRRKYYYELSKMYSEARRYTDALDILKKIEDRDANFYFYLANAYAMSGDFPKAISTLEKSIHMGRNDSRTLATLSNYHRQNYDFDKAIQTNEQALLMPDNHLAQLEDAKIKKSQGKLRDYQKIMDQILVKAKQDYRNQ